MGALLQLQGLLDWWLGLPWWVVLLAALVVAFAVAYAVEKIIIATLRAWAKRTRWQYDDVIVDAAHPSVSVLLFVALVWATLRWTPLNVSNFTIRMIDNASMTIVVLAAALAVTRIVRGLLRVRAKKEERWQRVSLLGSRLSAILIYVVAFLVVIKQYGIEITPILTTLGIAGLAVALALQDTLANVFAGIWIQTQKSMQPGHYVKLEEKNLEGFVSDVGWRTTKINTLGGNVIVVPNQAVAQATITDYWLPEPKMGTSLTVETGYEADPERVVQVLLEEAMAAANEVSFILKEPAPSARLNKATDKGWEFWMGFWVPYYYNQWNAQGYVLNRVRKRFLAEGIRMPYPMREQAVVAPGRPDLVHAVTAMHGVAAAERGEALGGAAAPPRSRSVRTPEEDLDAWHDDERGAGFVAPARDGRGRRQWRHDAGTGQGDVPRGPPRRSESMPRPLEPSAFGNGHDSKRPVARGAVAEATVDPDGRTVIKPTE